MKGEKIANITTDMGTIVAIVTFFACVGYLLFDLRIVLLDGWIGVWLRVVGIVIIICIGYVPYWFMSVFYRKMHNGFLGFGASVGFMMCDLSLRVVLSIYGYLPKSGYLLLIGIAGIFCVILCALLLCNCCIARCVQNRERIVLWKETIRQGIIAMFDRRIL